MNTLKILSHHLHFQKSFQFPVFWSLLQNSWEHQIKCRKTPNELIFILLRESHMGHGAELASGPHSFTWMDVHNESISALAASSWHWEEPNSSDDSFKQLQGSREHLSESWFVAANAMVLVPPHVPLMPRAFTVTQLIPSGCSLCCLCTETFGWLHHSQIVNGWLSHSGTLHRS